MKANKFANYTAALGCWSVEKSTLDSASSLKDLCDEDFLVSMLEVDFPSSYFRKWLCVCLGRKRGDSVHLRPDA